MSRRRRTIAALVAAAAAAVAVAYGAVRPAGDVKTPVGVAVNAIQGDYPAVGVHRSCARGTGFGGLRGRPRRRCVVRVCRLELEPVEWRAGDCTDVALRP